MTLSLRKSTSKDLGFVFSLAQNGARHGHFEAWVSKNKDACRAYLDGAISSETDPLGYLTKVFVATVDDTRVGAAIVATAVGVSDEGIELHLIALKKDCRGKGYGSVVLDTILNRYLPRGSVYARCLPASGQLRQMLLRRDFDEVGTSGNSVVLRHGIVD
jgi:GNAT superfamily N-acetyltransferase